MPEAQLPPKPMLREEPERAQNKNFREGCIWTSPN
jgi:hypothetical protein